MRLITSKLSQINTRPRDFYHRQKSFHIKRFHMSKIDVQNIVPDNVHTVLKSNMLVKGYDLVFDLEKSHGSYIVDSLTGKKYLDMFSFYASWPIAHNHPKLNNAVFKHELGTVAIHNPANSDIYTKEFAQFVATFRRVCIPAGFEHLFLISTGTLAVENALKVAFDWKTRKNLSMGKTQFGSKVIHFKEAFHGRSGYTLSLTNTADPAKYMYFPLFDWPRIINPKIKFPLEGENLEQVINLERIALNDIERVLQIDSDSIASIILECLQGEGGNNHFRPEFWQSLRKLADQYDVMLIADEVQTGMGLTGKMWAFEHMGASPDIICFGKKAQICGIICNSRVDEVPDNVFVVPSRINSTWGGNLTDMVRSKKIIEIIEEENLVENAKTIGEYLLDKLHQLGVLHPHKISNIRGKGLMCAFDLPDTKSCTELIDLAYDNQLLIISCGTRSIRLVPVLDVTKSDIDKLIKILDYCLTKLE